MPGSRKWSDFSVHVCVYMSERERERESVYVDSKLRVRAYGRTQAVGGHCQGDLVCRPA
jgi:hypothetical protein